jgi:hypothetical protein
MVDAFVVLVVAILAAILYGLIGEIKAWASGEVFTLGKFLATLIYSIFIGFTAAYSGAIDPATISWNGLALVFNPIWIEYLGLLYGIQKIIDAVIIKISGKPQGLATLFIKS